MFDLWTTKKNVINKEVEEGIEVWAINLETPAQSSLLDISNIW
jgi:hypothetical protein